MRTNKHHQLVAQLGASLMFIAAVSDLRGAVNIFTNRQAWETAVFGAGASSTTIIGFNFFPVGTTISNQFAAVGLEFLSQDGRFPITMDDVTNGVLNTPLFPGTAQTIRWRFTKPINAVGWERTSDDDTHFYRIFDVDNVELGLIDFRTPTQFGGPMFGGFISDVPIGFASSFSDNNDQLHSIDDLRFASVPEPSAYALLTIGLLAVDIVARRRKAL